MEDVTSDTQDGPHTNSIRALQTLYAVLVGVALTNAVTVIIDPAKVPVPVKIDALYLGLAFLITVIPFFHGAVRHLDRIYSESGPRSTRWYLFAGDFLGLFGEGCVLVAMAALLTRPRPFTSALLILLMADAIWSGAVWAVMRDKPHSERSWAWINAFAGVALGVLLLLTYTMNLPVLGHGRRLWVFVLPLCIFRSAVDYRVCWPDYYPAPD